MTRKNPHAVALGRAAEAAALYAEILRLPGRKDELGFVVDLEWRVLRDYPATEQDGRRVTLWVMRAPAQFFRLTTGDLEITTGSGTAMGLLMDELARAIAAGMVGFGQRG